MNKSLAEIASRMEGKLSSSDFADAQITSFCLDSRDAKADSLYLAIKGANVDGHDFIEEAIQNGSPAAVVEKPSPFPNIKVDNLVHSLKKMAISYRMEFNGPVVGVTGSSGKTTVKDMISICMETEGQVLKTKGNRNTEYTAPLVWCEELSNYHAAVIEMSMRGIGQVAHLASFSRPNVGVITNIGYSHLEMVHSREGIAQAKSELFDALDKDGLAIYWHDDDYSSTLKSHLKCPSASFGFHCESDCQITAYEQFGLDSMKVQGKCDGSTWEVQSKSVGKHIALAMACALLVSSRLGISLAKATESLAQFKMPQMRMEIQTYHGAKIIKDFYNASPDSMSAGLNTMIDSNPTGKLYAILGGMRELGIYSTAAHEKLGKELALAKLEKVLCLGELMKPTVDAALRCGMKNIELIKGYEPAIELVKSLKPGDVLFVKGSRYYELEQIFLDIK